jgi:hypothetical protein
MWINNNIEKPPRKGYYKTLVEEDGLGNLCEASNELFNGVDWDVYESHGQFVNYWWANKEDYDTIADKLEKEHEIFLEKLTQESKEFNEQFNKLLCTTQESVREAHHQKYAK